MKLSRPYDLSHECCKLVMVTWVIFCLFFIYFSISSFNIRLIGNQTLYFLSIHFLWGYLDLLTWVWQVNSSYSGYFFYSFLFDFFFNLILENWVDWELIFIFFLFFMGLSWSYDLDHAVKLIDSGFFCHFLSFFNFILQYQVD